ncbi:hypothetical protein F4703DRAFT_1889085 [Phycomyces blakesleeanus]
MFHYSLAILRISCLSFLSHKCSQSLTAPTDKLIPCQQKGYDLWSGRIKMSCPIRKFRPSNISIANSLNFLVYIFVRANNQAF